MISWLELAQKGVEVEHRPGLEMLDEWRQQVVNLLAAVLQLGRLPHHVNVLVAHFALHRQETQHHVALLDYLSTNGRHHRQASNG